MRQYGEPETIVTDKLKLSGAALRELGVTRHETDGCWTNNRAENTHQPFRRRERTMHRFRRMRSLQESTSIHSPVHNHFIQERHLSRQKFQNQPYRSTRRMAATLCLIIPCPAPNSEAGPIKNDGPLRTHCQNQKINRSRHAGSFSAPRNHCPFAKLTGIHLKHWFLQVFCIQHS